MSCPHQPQLKMVKDIIDSNLWKWMGITSPQTVFGIHYLWSSRTHTWKTGVLSWEDRKKCEKRALASIFYEGPMWNDYSYWICKFWPFWKTKTFPLRMKPWPLGGAKAGADEDLCLRHSGFPKSILSSIYKDSPRRTVSLKHQASGAVQVKRPRLKPHLNMTLGQILTSAASSQNEE